MAINVELGDLEPTVERLVANGHYSSTSDVLREGVRLLAQRQEALDGLFKAAFEDDEAGRVIPAEEAFDRLIAKYDAIARACGE